MNLNKRENIEMIEQRTNDGTYDYLVNSQDKEYSIMKIINDSFKMNLNEDGWRLWIIKNPDQEEKRHIDGDCLFVQVINENGHIIDTHILTEDEINNFVIFFAGDNYTMNKIQ